MNNTRRRLCRIAPPQSRNVRNYRIWWKSTNVGIKTARSLDILNGAIKLTNHRRRHASTLMRKSALGPAQVTSFHEPLEELIYVIRCRRVMLDFDLAALYEVPTKALNQALRRNAARFPEDFAFQLPKDDLENWRSQIVASNPAVSKRQISTREIKAYRLR
jgi:ORF6N domain